MCGIAGSYARGPLDGDSLAGNLRQMADTIAHRGPDDQGVWVDSAAGIGFAHRRLSIIDLSPLGHQPMHSGSGRYTITFNGEIYNYRELRTELTGLGHSFRGASDTEVLLAAIEQWGIRETLTKSVGMLAFGLWDRETRTLTLARDRFGEKPLYYGIFKDSLVFGSELKAIRKHRDWRADIDRDALSLLVRHGFIPAPHSVFRQCRKVRPGHYASIRLRDDGFTIVEEAYWDPRQEMQDGIRTPFAGTPNEAVDHLESLLSAAVGRQLVADVPVGAFLSGGIDSSLVVALMQKASRQPVRTFAIGFVEKDMNEAPYAKSVATHLGTEHRELIVTPNDALAVIPRLSEIYDEPFADVSQIPTFLVSQLARSDVTVSLSGDAGDELFGGYGRYQIAEHRWRLLSKIPRALRATAAGAIRAVPPPVLGAISACAQLTNHRKGRPDLGDRLREKSRELGARSAGDYYGEMFSYFHWPEELVLGSHEPSTVSNSPSSWPEGVDSRRLMMYQDTCQYLPDDILVKVDRAAMAVALETRVPMLDPQFARAAWSLPSALHFADGRGKWVLRQILERHIPRSLIDRPKTGFGVPIDRWLRKDLRDWAEALLDGSRLDREGIFNRQIVARRWQQHLASEATDWSFHIWIILMFQAWLTEWGSSAGK